MTSSRIPVITLDGPSGVGKGTVGLRLAHRLNWHFLDSGALYRLLAWIAAQKGAPLDDEAALAQLAAVIRPDFEVQPGGRSLAIRWRDQEVSAALRSEACAEAASKLAVWPAVRAALLEAQRTHCRPPGLVADGRDMGTVVFPDASLKIFLTASAQARAARRHAQLNAQGKHASLAELEAALVQRDRRDTERPVAALEAAQDAFRIDTSDLSVDQVLAVIETKLRGCCVGFYL